MLILTRHPSEEILIEPDICIKIIRVRGTQVRLGISVPKGRNVRRAELPLIVSKDHKKVTSICYKKTTTIHLKSDTSHVCQPKEKKQRGDVSLKVCS